MDSKISIWNVLHDGAITAIECKSDGILTMFVNIPYLRKRLKPLGDSFILKLRGIKKSEFEDFDGKKNSLQEEIDSNNEIEILSSDSNSMPVIINTTMGKIILDFENISFFLDSGEEIEFDTISKVCDDYWTEWENNSKKMGESK